MRTLLRLAALVLSAVALLVALLVVRALRLPSRQIALPPAPARAVDADAAARRLAEAIRIPTISHSNDPARVEAEAFARFHAWLAESYPRLHRTLALERVGEHSLLYTWEGRDLELEPVLLVAHQDVVPAENAERWSRPPFEGRVEDGFVWGRGAVDDKGSIVAICEAVEALLAEGFVPRRGVMLAFGHDEEIGGGGGAARIAERLAQRGVRAAMVLDEGMAVMRPGVLPGLSRLSAPIGVAEKGSATLELVAQAAGGHSSTPPRQTAAGILARAVARLEDQPMPAAVGGVTGAFFAQLAPELPLPLRVPLANMWLFGGPAAALLRDQPAVNALLRTTTAVTMLSGSPKENVLPVQAVAVVNFRILPGETAQLVLERTRAIVDDPRVEVRFRSTPRDPSPVSPWDVPAFELLRRTIAERFPDTVVAPALVVGGTDARHYRTVSDRIYRFLPFLFGTEDLTLPHGIDERLAVESLAEGVRWYARLLENASAESFAAP
jgi:carboxypeptidase PM20D1